MNGKKGTREEEDVRKRTRRRRRKSVDKRKGERQTESVERGVVMDGGKGGTVRGSNNLDGKRRRKGGGLVEGRMEEKEYGKEGKEDKGKCEK